MESIAQEWTEKWSFTLPARHGGYHIEAAINSNWRMPPTHAFWYLHLLEKETVAVTNEPVVFRDDTKKTIIRYADVNSADPDGALKKLQEKRPKQQWKSTQNPSYLFAFAGEIGAVDAMREWCAQEKHTVRRVVRKDVREPDKAGSLLLLGNSRTSRIVREALKEMVKFPYTARVDETVGGRSYIEVQNPTEPEQENIRTLVPGHYSPTPLQSLTEQLVSMGLEPRTESLSEDDNWKLVDNPGSVVFGIVSRYRAQRGNPVTVIASDYSRAIESITIALTDDQWLGDVLNSVGWNTGKPVPERFQWLLSVNLGTEEADMRVTAQPMFICCATEPRI
jgi:hypothetical protein